MGIALHLLFLTAAFKKEFRAFEAEREREK